MTAKNSAGEATAMSAATAVVVAAAPANIVLPVISGEAKDEKTVTTSTGMWTGSPTITYSYQWESCNTSGESCASISGATASSYTIVHEEVGHTIRVKVTAKNSAGEASASSAATAVVVAAAPANIVLPVISGEAKDEKTLSASTGTWSGSPTITYSYQWESCNTFGEGCSNISGATDSSYTIAHEQVGDTIRVKVTAKNSAGEASATSAATATVAASAPANTALPTISGEAKDEKTLTASTGTWSGSPPITYSYQWESCNTAGESCINISGATSSSYAITHEQVGDTIRVKVTAENSAGEASATSAQTDTVAASAPANTVLPAVSGEAKDEKTLSASTGTWSGSPTITYSYQWESCNTAGESCINISGATSSSYAITHEQVGDTIRVKVTAENSAGEASATSAQTATVVAAAPANTALPVISGEAKDEKTLTASTGTWSGSPTITYSYQWESCNTSGESCTNISGATGTSYTIAHEQVGDTIRVKVTAKNSAGEATASSAATATVAAAAPANTALPTISGEAKDEKTLTASTGSWSGTPPLSYAYQWQSCDSLGEGCLDISGATMSSHTLGSSEVGDTLRVVVTATNAAGSAAATSEATAVVTGSGSGGPLVYSAQFGSQGSGNGQFNHPGDIAIDSSGHLFVLDQGNDRVEVFNEEGGYLRQFGSEGSGAGQMSGPDGLALDSKGDVWVVDTGNGRVEEFNGEGVFVKTVGAGEVGSAEGIAVDRHDDVWVAETYQGRLAVFNNEGHRLKTVGSKGSGAGQLGEPEGLAVDREGHVLVADWANNRVEEFNEAGEYIRQFGSAGSGNGEISHPYGIAADENDDVWVGEVGNDRVQEFAEDGEYISQLGTPGSEPGELSLSYPIGLVVDAARDVWVTDSGNNRVEEWASSAIAPSNTIPPDVTGELIAGETLRSSNGSWEGTPPLTYSYQWQSCTAAGSECANIAGATNSSYTLGNGEIGASVRVLVTAANAAGSATATSPSSPVISPATPPSNTAPPVISGTTLDGQTLTASTGAWTGTSPTYTYQWQSCNTQGEECREIEGATSENYTLGSGDLETTLRVLVTATNAAGSAHATSAASSEIEPGAPSELEAPSISGDPSAGETLHADAGVWGGTEAEVSYQWERCNATGDECADVAGATEAEYKLGEGDIGSTLRARVAVSNALGSLTAISPATEVIGAASSLMNTWAPSVSGTPQSGHTLTANAGSWLGVATIGYEYQWLSCDRYGSACTDIEGATASTYALKAANVGNTLRVRVSATETGATVSQTSAVTQPIAAENAPVIDEPPVVSGTGLVGYTLTATGGGWSGEGSLGYAYQWQRCDEGGESCTAISGATSNTYILTEGDVASTLRVLVTATDEGASTTGASSPTAAISPTTLVNVTAPSISGAHEYGRALSADHGIWAGAGAIAYAYQWERCNEHGESCSTITGATESSYTPGESDVGKTVKVKVTATGTAGTDIVTSAVTPVIVSEPIAPENLIAPSIEGNLTAGDTLTAQPGTWLSSETISYSYQWQRCSADGEECADIEGATGDTYVLREGDIGSTLRVVVTATNSLGSASAISYQSEAVGAPGPPAVSESPTIHGTAREGAVLFAGNGIWTGSRPLTYYYRWERCNTSGENCVSIEGATKPSYTATSADVGSTLRVKVTVTNSVGSASAVSAPALVAPGTEGNVTQALETAEATDPSILAPSTTATLEQQTVKPAIGNTGEVVASSNGLTSSTISKETAGEFAVNTSVGELSFTPLDSSANATTTPTIVNGAAAVFAETSHVTDTFVRPTPLGATTLLQMRSSQAPTSFSWEVGIGSDQELEQLPDGSVAVVEPGSGPDLGIGTAERNLRSAGIRIRRSAHRRRRERRSRRKRTGKRD